MTSSIACGNTNTHITLLVSTKRGSPRHSKSIWRESKAGKGQHSNTSPAGAVQRSSEADVHDLTEKPVAFTTPAAHCAWQQGGARTSASSRRTSVDTSCWVRLKSVAHLRRLALSDDKTALFDLVVLTGDPSWQVREDAVKALGYVTEPKCAVFAIRAVSMCLRDSSFRVRKAATSAFERLSRLVPEGVVRHTEQSQGSQAGHSIVTKACDWQKQALAALAGAAATSAIVMVAMRLVNAK